MDNWTISRSRDWPQRMKIRSLIWLAALYSALVYFCPAFPFFTLQSELKPKTSHGMCINTLISKGGVCEKSVLVNESKVLSPSSEVKKSWRDLFLSLASLHCWITGLVLHYTLTRLAWAVQNLNNPLCNVLNLVFCSWCANKEFKPSYSWTNKSE